MKYDVQLCEVLRRAQTAENTFDYTVLAPKLAEVAQPDSLRTFTCPAKRCAARFPFVTSIRKTARCALCSRFAARVQSSSRSLRSATRWIFWRPSATALRSTRTRTICSSAAVSVCLRFSVQQGNAAKNATVAVGFRNKDFVILEDDFHAAGCDLRIATDDGSYGHHGLVIDLIQDVHPDKIFACGPKVMLRAVTEFAKAHNIPCEISLEERMRAASVRASVARWSFTTKTVKRIWAMSVRTARCSRRKGWYSDG